MNSKAGDAPEIAIYVAAHDRSVTFNKKEAAGENIRIPIQAGAALSEQSFCQIKDDTGDNISGKNSSFCELTAMYWIWKHDHHKIKGLEHYRRKFLMDEEEIRKALKTHEIIVPPSWFFRESLLTEYESFHRKDDLEKLLEVVHTVTPEYDEALRRVLNQNELISYNMMIAPETVWNDYCAWLFSILFPLEKMIEDDGRDAYQRRVFGFLSERLFTAYVKKNFLNPGIGRVEIPETENAVKCAKYLAGRQVNRWVFGWRKPERELIDETKS